MTLPQRLLGRTQLAVSCLAFGAGPVSGLMTGDDHERQESVIKAALAAGINWFDTAPGYGQGKSEENLGRALLACRPSWQIHLATKVRIPEGLTEPTADYVRKSVEASLKRLQVDRVTLLQLHNGITSQTSDEPDSLSVDQIMAPAGVADAMRRVKDEGLVQFLGLTGTGQSSSLRAVIHSGQFDTIQIPYHLLNPSAGMDVQFDDDRVNYGNLIADCADERMGVFAIRVFAGGALFDQPPSSHTQSTRYFPLALYERDLKRAVEIRKSLSVGSRLASHAIEFVLNHPAVSSAIIGFGSVAELQDCRPLPP